MDHLQAEQNGVGTILRNGSLLGIYGVTQESNNVKITPAEIELEGDSFDSEFDLIHYTHSFLIPFDLKHWASQRLDAVWIRARIESVFNTHSLGFDERPEKTLMFFSFVATIYKNQQAVFLIPFECSDYYGKSALTFSEFEKDEELKATIAQAFWSLLLKGDEISDYKDTFFHPGTGEEFDFGCQNGLTYYNKNE